MNTINFDMDTYMANLMAAAEAEDAKQRQEKVQSPEFRNAFISEHNKGRALNSLKGTVKDLKRIVESNKLAKRDGTDRKFNGRYIFGLGDQFAELACAVSGYMYAADEHKLMMKPEVYGLDISIASSFMEALGSLPYYSTNTQQIIEGTNANIDKLLELVDLISIKFGFTIDTASLNQVNYDKVWNKASIQADTDKANFEKALVHNSIFGTNYVMEDEA